MIPHEERGAAKRACLIFFGELVAQFGCDQLLLTTARRHGRHGPPQVACRRVVESAVRLHHEGRCQALPAARCCDRTQSSTDVIGAIAPPPAALDAFAVAHLHQRGRCQAEFPTAGHHCAQRLLKVEHARRLALALAVPHLDQRRRHDERVFAVEHVPIDAVRDPPHGGVDQILVAAEDAATRNRPVDAIRRRAVRLKLARGLLGMRALGPHDWQTVAARDHVEARPSAVGTVVRIADDAPLHCIPHRAQALDEVLPVASKVLLVGHKELAVPRHILARPCNSERLPICHRVHHLVQGDHAAGRRISLCDQW
ncbi:hypothetical protein D3C86_1281540 [compost metagenome]